MEFIHWTDLKVDHEYYTKMLGPTFGVNNSVKKIKIQGILILPNNEAMIYVSNENNNVLGFAVGGIFEETELGPKHRFWIEHSYAAAAG